MPAPPGSDLRHKCPVTREHLKNELEALQLHLQEELRETRERLREGFKTDLAPLLAMVQELQPEAQTEAEVPWANRHRLIQVQPKEQAAPAASASPLRKAEEVDASGAALATGSPSFPSEADSFSKARKSQEVGVARAWEEEEENKEDMPMSSSQVNFDTPWMVQRRRKMDNRDKSRKWQSKKVNRKSNRSHTATGAAFLDKARSKEIKHQRWASGILEHDYFNWVLVATLLANALTFGIQANVVARNRSHQTPAVFNVINIIFTVIFSGELFLRVYAYRKSFLTGDDWSWNLFDSVVVLSSIIDEVSSAMFGTATEMQQHLLGFAGVLRMLRLGRVLRLLRLIRVIPALKSMVYLISASMNSFFWTGVLLLILMYCVAVYFTDLATDVIRLNNSKGLDYSEIEKYWGSLGQAVSSLFQAITGGMDWRVVVEVFQESSPELHELLNIIFSLYIAFATLVMLNLVTGVFVEGAQRIAKEEKEQELLKSVQKLCKMTDTSGDGEITWDEFEANLIAPEMEAYLKAFDMDPNQARDIFYVLDRDDTGTVSLEEFVGASIKLHAPARMADREILKNYMKDSFAEMSFRLARLEQQRLRPKMERVSEV